MRIRGELPRKHGAGQWLVCGVSAACGIGLLIAAVYLPIRTLDVKDNGIRTTARVEDVHHDGKTTNYELDFTLQDGTAFDTWTSDVHYGTRVGDSIQIAYLSEDPTAVQDVRDLGRWWIAPLIFVPLGGFFLWVGWSMWRLDPVTFKGALRARYGHRR
jgi:hypothetical protein